MEENKEIDSSEAGSKEESAEGNAKKSGGSGGFAAFFLLLILAGGCLLFQDTFSFEKHTGSEFGIYTYRSERDWDGDGIDDQSDLLRNARAYLSKRPSYESKYYSSGYPDDNYGVCTDVIAFAMRGAGYDLMELVNEHIRFCPWAYDIDLPDKCIDFRRVKNLLVYFEYTAISLTRDIYDIEEWQGGDIVVWKDHIGMISEYRNEKGIPYVLHHARPMQFTYEEDILETQGEILGHFRIS